MQLVSSWLLGRALAFRYAFAGIRVLLGQRNTYIHLFIALVVVVCGLLWRLSSDEWLALTLIITIVLALEAVNTALEAVVDLASPQLHPLAKQAKDVGAAAVLVGALGAVVVALLIFGPRLLVLARWLTR
ncbi:MAG: diacylglycerol kinase family protein [Herpetosiphonaceae bacterium]|nr:diacylglycerol kinase family protein [Herpetosiphonaceae bacterium]